MPPKRQHAYDTVVKNTLILSPMCRSLGPANPEAGYARSGQARGSLASAHSGSYFLW